MNYIICGIEHIGIKVVNLLVSFNESITVITLDQKELLLQEIKDQVVYVEGDARQAAVLEAAGIGKADILMALTSNDVKNIEIHLTAKMLNPNVKVITSLTTEGLSKDLEAGFKIQRALNIAYLAAPSFLSACLDESVIHTFLYNNKLWFIGSLEIAQDSILLRKKLREIEIKYNLKAYRIEEQQDTSIFTSCPDQLSPGDKFFFIANSKKVLELIAGKRVRGRKAPKTEVQFRAEETILEHFKSIPRNVKYITLCYSALLLVSVMLFHFGMRLSLIDAFYFAITTTTTVGFGDFSFKDAPFVYKLYGSFLMIAGAALLAAIFSVITDLLISKRFEEFFGTGKHKWKNHVIITGLSSIGYRVANLLHEYGLKVVVIEKDPENKFVHLLRGRIPIIYGDAQYSSVLQKARITEAEAIAAIIDDELKNLNILLQAKKLNEKIRTVARTFNHKIEETARESFAIDYVLSTSSIVAPLYLASAVQPRTIFAFAWKNSLLIIFEVKVQEYPVLSNFTPRQFSEIFRLYLIALANSKHQNSPVDDLCSFSNEDTLLLMGKYEDVYTFSRQL